MILRHPLISLRPVEPADVDTLYIFENSPGAVRTGFASAPVSRQSLWEYAEAYSADIFAEKQLRLMIVENSSGKTVGTIDLAEFDPRDRRAFAGIYIAEDSRRRGYAYAAIELIKEYCASTLGMHQLAAVVAADNAPSRALFEKAGFKTCGRLRSWLRTGSTYTDALILQILFCG